MRHKADGDSAAALSKNGNRGNEGSVLHHRGHIPVLYSSDMGPRYRNSRLGYGYWGRDRHHRGQPRLARPAGFSSVLDPLTSHVCLDCAGRDSPSAYRYFHPIPDGTARRLFVGLRSPSLPYCLRVG